MENSSASKPDFNITPFGVLPNGQQVMKYRLTNNDGIEMHVLDYGCIITSLFIPTVNDTVDIVLGFDDLNDYIDSYNLPAPPYFGAVIGRYSGRIKNGQFHLGTEQFQLPINNNGHTLHGGTIGFDKVIWQVKTHTANSIVLIHESLNGEQNFPGNLSVEVSYTLTDDNDISIQYTGQCDQDTIINMTQHSYFNLDGHTGNVTDQQLQINSNTMLEADSDIIPTGKMVSADSLGFNFTNPAPCPSQIDNSFVIDKIDGVAAVLKSVKNGLQMTITSNQPSLHLYVGGNLFGKLRGKDGFSYHPKSGICFESQNFPDAPNHLNFPNAVLKAGDIYNHRTRWHFDNAAKI